MAEFNKEAPVVVAGVGGSGTRVVADILQQLSFYIGNDLNKAKDNLWFTFLFKRPGWLLKQNEISSSDIQIAFKIFLKAMTGNRPVSGKEFFHIIQASLQSAKHVSAKRGIPQALIQLVKRINSIYFKTNHIKSDYAGWGWKEPNSHIYLERLHLYFPKMKYIHTIRNGLDMAFSQNQNQVKNWGHLFGIKSTGKLSTPQESLKYWIAANRKAIHFCKDKLGKKFYLLNFDTLCLNPANEVPKLINFIIEKPVEPIDEKILQIPKIPPTLGRYKNHDLNIFDEEDLREVERMGFKI